MLITEEWKDVEEFEGLYQVSNKGRVKSLSRNRLLKLYKSDNYVQCHLCKNNKITLKLVHRLVSQAFIPNHDNKKCVNHINGNKHDNQVENLEWCTYSENSKHAFQIGLQTGIKGENNHLSKLQTKDIIDIRKIQGLYKYQIAALYNVDVRTIRRILKGETWSHVQ